MMEGQLDWERRYQLMCTHPALHIHCGVVFRDHRARVIRGDMEPLHGRTDFEFKALTHDLLGKIEEAVNSGVGAVCVAD